MWLFSAVMRSVQFKQRRMPLASTNQALPEGDLEMREVPGDHSLRKDLEAVVTQAVPAAS